MKKIYFDNNATTKVNEEVFQKMLPFLKENFYNPSSSYEASDEIKEQIKSSRKEVAKLINADLKEIIFTSCATESNITAIFSAIRSNPEKKKIITSTIEHTSILETMKYLETIGYEIIYLSVDENGNLNLEELQKSIDNNVALVTLMYSNNEIGTIFPIEKIAKICHEKNILVHVDAVQAVGKCLVDVKKIGVDFLTIAGHKMYAPKGIGVLFKRANTPFVPLLFGHQENNYRGGTENVPYIIGLGVACEILNQNIYNHIEIMTELRIYLETKLKENFTNYKIYGINSERICNTISLAFYKVPAINLQILLEQNNILVSTGSACNSKTSVPSHVLTSMNANLEDYSPIRISFGIDNTKEEIDELIRVLKFIIK